VILGKGSRQSESIGVLYLAVTGPYARTWTTIIVTPTKLTIWALTSVSAAVIGIFIPPFGEEMWVLDALLPIAAFLCVAAIGGLALNKITTRHSRRIAIGLAIGAFTGLAGSSGPADAQAGLETLITLPIGIVSGAFAGFLLRPPEDVVEKLPVDDC
jgi:hypothetical protein